MEKLFVELSKPFHPSNISWKPGTIKGDHALAMPYADLRVYMNRLDEVCGADWSVVYTPWGEDRIICQLAIHGVTRSSTGEMGAQDEKNDIGGTVAEAMAFKRACAMWGLGRYLYNLPTGWADYDPKNRQFTAAAKAKLTGILVQHYRRANAPNGLPKGGAADALAEMFAGDGEKEEVQPRPEGSRLVEQFNTLGQDLYGDQWESVCRRNVERISGGKAQESGELAPDQLQKLIDGMAKLKSQRVPMNDAVAK